MEGALKVILEFREGKLRAWEGRPPGDRHELEPDVEARCAGWCVGVPGRVSSDSRLIQIQDSRGLPGGKVGEVKELRLLLPSRTY